MENKHRISTFKLPPAALANLDSHINSTRADETNNTSEKAASATQHISRPLMTPPTEQRLPDVIGIEFMPFRVPPRANEPLSSSLSAIKSLTPDAEGQSSGFMPINGLAGGSAQSGFSPLVPPAIRAASTNQSRAGSQGAGGTSMPVPWTVDEDNILRMWGPFVDSTKISWPYVAAKFQNRKHGVCKSRWNFLKKTRGQAAAVKLEPAVDLTNDMFQAPSTRIELDGPQQDELWHLGMTKYTDDITWAQVAERHSKDWTSMGRDGQVSVGAPAANTCGRWTIMCEKKCEEVANGVVLEAWRPMGAEQKIPILPGPNIKTWENCPPKLRARLEGGGNDGLHKRRAGGVQAVSARLGRASGHDAKRARLAPTNEVIVDPEEVQMKEQADVERLNIGLPQTPKQPSAEGVHTTFEKVSSTKSSCSWCNTLPHIFLYQCTECEALLCTSCLEGNIMTTHHLPQQSIPMDIDNDTVGVTRNAPSDIPIFQDAANYGQDEPLRQKSERLAKTKAQARVRESVKQLEPMRSSSAPKSSPRGKKSPVKSKKRLSAPTLSDDPQPTWTWNDDGSSTPYDSDDDDRVPFLDRKKAEKTIVDKSRAARKAAPSKRHRPMVCVAGSSESAVHRESQATRDGHGPPPDAQRSRESSGSGRLSTRQKFDPVRDTAPRTSQRPASVKSAGSQVPTAASSGITFAETARLEATARAVQAPPVALGRNFTPPVARNQPQHAHGRSIQSLPNHSAGLMSPITATGSPIDTVKQPHYPTVNTAVQQNRDAQVPPQRQDARMVGPPWTHNMPAMSQPPPPMLPIATADDESDDEDDLAHRREMERIMQETEFLKRQREEDESAIKEHQRRLKKVAREQERQRVLDMHNAAAVAAMEARERRNRAGFAPAGPPVNPYSG